MPSQEVLLQKYNQPVPRYTSYPPATLFHEGIDTHLYQQWLQSIPTNAPLSIYVHLPFCKSLCWYCGCNMKVSSSENRMAQYMAALYKEIDLVCAHIHQTPTLSHLHLGGGTPTHLPPHLMAQLLQKLATSFNAQKSYEKAVEIDPRQCTLEMVKVLALHGFTRASLGVQDTNLTVQQAINRVQPLSLVQTCVENLRQCGFKNINFDLIYGLPHQTPSTITQTIHDVLTLNPSRIALFGYAHVPWMKQQQKLLEKDNALPQAAARDALAQSARQTLVQAGYVAVGMDHFVQPGDTMETAWKNKNLHRNFQGYTTDTSEYLLGFGASAISQLPQGFVQNQTDLKHYETAVLNERIPITKGYLKTRADKLYGPLIEKLMCQFEAPLNDLPFDEQEKIRKKLNLLEQDGLLVYTENQIIATPLGQKFIRTICANIDPTFKIKPSQHAQAL